MDESLEERFKKYQNKEDDLESRFNQFLNKEDSIEERFKNFSQPSQEPSKIKSAVKGVLKSIPFTAPFAYAIDKPKRQEESLQEKWNKITQIKDPQERIQAVKGMEGIESNLLDDPVFTATLSALTGGGYTLSREGMKRAIKVALREGVGDITYGATDVPKIGKEIIKFFKTSAGKKVLVESQAFLEQTMKSVYPKGGMPTKMHSPEAMKSMEEALNFTKVESKQPEKLVKESVNIFSKEYPKQKVIYKFGAEQKAVRPKSIVSTQESQNTFDNMVKDISKEKDEVTKGVWEGIKNTKMTPLIEKLQYDWKRVKNWEQTPGLKLTSTLTPSETRQLMFGRIRYASREAEQSIKSIDKDLLKTSKELKIKDIDLKKEVNDYLISKHAPEFNREHGEAAAKITTEEAQNRLREIDKLPYADKVKELASKIKSFHDDTLKLSYSNGASYGLINEDEMKFYQELYPEHVPYYRVREDEDIIDVLSGKGLGVSGSGIKHAKGSQLDIEDILQNVYVARLRTVQRLEKNMVDNAVYDAVEDTMKSFPEQDLFELGKPKAIGKDFQGKIMTNRKDIANDPTMLPLRRYGEDAYVKINNPQLAVAIKGMNREKVNGFIKFAGILPRYYAAMATRYNIDFVLSNKIKDLPEALVSMAASKESSKKSVFKALTSDVKSVWDIRNYLKGKETEGAKIYKEMRSLGVGGSGGSFGTTKDAIKSIKRIINENRNSPTALLQKIIEPINKLNVYFEDSSKLTVFKQLRKQGVDPKKAAIIAKEAGIDFDKMGTWGSTVNSIWMFSNASIQASTRTLKALVKNPKVLLGTTTALGASVWAAGEWNDKIDPDWRKKVSKWDQVNGFNIMLNDEGNYITIPSSFSLKPIKVLWDKAYNLAHNEKVSTSEAAKDLTTAIIDGYTPLSGSDPGQALTPTALRLPADLSSNKSYTGWDIANKRDQYAPASIQYYPSLEKTIQGQILIEGTKALSEKSGKRIEINPAQVNYVLENIKGGAGRTPFKTVEAVKGIINPDKEHPVLNVLTKAPITSRFFRKSEPEHWKDAEEEQIIKEDMGEISRERFYQNKDLKKIMEEDFPGIMDFIGKYPPEDREKLINKFVEAKQKKGVPDKAWYQKLSYLPPEVREKIFEIRYNKSSVEVKSQMRKAAGSFPGFLTDNFFMQRALRKRREKNDRK